MTTQLTRNETIESITINALEWLDKINGNSYHASHIYVEFKDGTDLDLYAPFQYGYGDHYVQAAGELLTERGVLEMSPMSVLWTICDDHGIILHKSITTALKREVVALGAKGEE